VAAISVETGIAPNDLLDAPDGMLDAILDVLKRRKEERQKAARKR
jgi:hypothetical protein